jgi:hypothetical protein
MAMMFYLAPAFDQDIGGWDVRSLTDAADMFNGSALTLANYDALLTGWDAQNLQPGVTFDGGNSTYCLGQTARANMIATDGWAITDGGKDCPSGLPTLIAPLGGTPDNTPLYQWEPVYGATEYRLELYQGDTKIYTLYPKSGVCDAAECKRNPGIALAEGSYKWRMKSMVNGDWSDFGDYKYFTVGWTSDFVDNIDGWATVKGWWGLINGGGWFRTNGSGVLDEPVSVRHDDNYEILTFEVKMMRKNDAIGANRLYILGTPYPLTTGSEWKSAYIFQYANAGYISVVKTVNGTQTPLLNWTLCDEINAYGFNILKVVASGGTMKFYVNDVKVWEGSDSELTSGKVGIGMVKNASGWAPLNIAWAKFYPKTYSVTSVEPMATLGESFAEWDNYNVSPRGAE